MSETLSSQDLLARLVAFDTTSRNSNLPLIDFIADYLDRPGVRIERNLSPDGCKATLVVFVGPEAGDDRRGLVLSGHTDTVPALEPDWQNDPFTLADGGDRWLGRGTCDMKGFIALAVNAAARVHGARLAHPLVLILTYDEEVGCLGAGHFVRTWPEPRRLPRNAIIGEPTSLEVVRMHKGHTKMRFTVRGKSAHSGYPHLGENAIEPAARVITALAELRRELEEERSENSPFFPDVPFVALNVAQVEGGVAINVVPERCVVHAGVRVLPGMKEEPITARLESAARRAAADCEVEVLDGSPPLLLAEDTEIYRALTEMVGQRETRSANYGTDGGWLHTLGLDCAVFGPGNIEVAHKPNEWLAKAEFARATDMIGGMIDRFCR